MTLTTDCHSMGRRKPEYRESYARVAAQAGGEMAENIFMKIPQKLLADEVVGPWAPVLAPRKKGLLWRLKTAFAADYV